MPPARTMSPVLISVASAVWRRRVFQLLHLEQYLRPLFVDGVDGLRLFAFRHPALYLLHQFFWMPVSWSTDCISRLIPFR